MQAVLKIVASEPSSSECERRSRGAGSVPASAWRDEELLARILAREAMAWREFVRRYRPVIDARIDSVLRRFPHVMGDADADDIRGVLMYSLQTRDMYRLRAFDVLRGVRFSTWIGILARNAAWDYLRAHTRTLATVHGVELDRVDPQTEDPERRLDARQQSLLLQARVSALSERDKWFLGLYMDDREPEDISRVMNISVRTVYTKKHKLQVKLR
jgi:RNA polymerase sigma-70 factor (ECF subfamily)